MNNTGKRKTYDRKQVLKFSMLFKCALNRCQVLKLFINVHSSSMATGADMELEDCVLTAKQGQVRGVKRTTIYDHSYYSFEGIPYAKPPLGELRFRSPEPATSWTGILDCTELCDKPVQKNPVNGNIEGSEDCLYVNIYVKMIDSEQPLPVLVWIYGGGFYKGEGSRRRHGPDYFMQQNVVLVSFNYRLCALGFLSLADPELQVPGNVGLKDQVLALKWVKQNISHFNGDTDNITVFGESAGAASAHYMSLTEQTRGLFHKSIIMSGCVLNNWANITQQDVGYRLAKERGYEGGNDDGQVLRYLRDLPANLLVGHDLLNENDIRNDQLFLFAPTVEPYLSADCVIPRSPLEMLRSGWGNEIPMILGGTSFEGLLMYPYIKSKPENTACLPKDPERVLPLEVRSMFSAEERQHLAAKIIAAHFREKEPNEETLFEHLDLYSYKVFWHSFYRTALARLTYSSAPTYMYRFDFDSPDFNIYRTKYCGTDPVRGVAHADDLCYLFYLRESWKQPPESLEYQTIERMIAMWTAFAKNSNPNCAEIEPVIWEPLQPSRPSMALNISDKLAMLVLPESPKLELWNNLYPREHLF